MLLKVDHGDSSWNYDTVDEFLADFRKYNGYALFYVYGGGVDLHVSFNSRDSSVSVKAPSRGDIESIFEIFEKHAASSRLPVAPVAPPTSPVIFIGHGRSP